MKILHVEMGEHLYGGARQVVYLMEGLNAQGAESLLLTPKDSAISKEVSALGNKVVEAPYSGDLDIRLAFRVKNLVKELAVDLVHVHSRRGADVWAGLGAKWAGIPAVLSRRVDNPEGPKSIRYKYALYEQVISISEGIKKVLVANGLPSSKVICVRSAFVASDSQSPIDRPAFMQRFNLPEDSLVVATVAQLIPRKGHKLLLDCLPNLLDKYPRMQVLFFGAGAEREALQQQIDQLGLSDRVHLVGFHNDLNCLIGNVDILAHPAYTEGLGVSLIQASAASVPIVACNAGGMPEIVRDHENGLLISPGDGIALSNAIGALADNPELRKQYGSRGKEIAEKEFSVEAMVLGNLNVYNEILGTPSGKV